MSRSFLGSVKDKFASRSDNKANLASQSQSQSQSVARPRPSHTSVSHLWAGETRSALNRSMRQFQPGGTPSTPSPRYSTAVGGPDDPPPAYTPTAPPVSRQAASDHNNSRSNDDQYAFLGSFDTVFLIDDSASMRGRSWAEVKRALRAIAPICTAYDQDGIDVFFLNHRSSAGASGTRPTGGYLNVTSSSAVEDIFTSVSPSAATPTGTRLNHLLKPYMEKLSHASDMESVKPVNIIVITDGIATDDPESVIVQHARKLDRLEAPPSQVGIQFFQVGNDREARRGLQELDDDLGDQGIRDIVDTVTWDNGRETTLTADGILKTVLGAVVRRLDRRNTACFQSRRI